MSFFDSFFDEIATFLTEFLRAVFAAFENFDAVIGVGVVGGSDVDGDVETHFGKAVVDGWGGKYADVTILDAESFESSFEVG